jgi:glutamate synthase domain-containing protein 1
MKTETKKAIDRLNQVIDDYINIFNTDKKEIKEIEQSLKVLIKKTESEE